MDRLGLQAHQRMDTALLPAWRAGAQRRLQRMGISGLACSASRSSRFPLSLGRGPSAGSNESPMSAAKRLKPAALDTPEQFWAAAVVPREPALFASLSPDLAHLRDLWTDEHLDRAAGGAMLELECRGSERDGFGKGPDTRVRLAFGQVLRRTAAGDASLYLTTQRVPAGPDGHPALYASPIAELAGDVPLAPAVMGRLIPQSINLWMGAARDGSSTGLHVDYHDNLYVLLRGRKRFRLYPPQQAKRMYTVGRVERIHPNGRIVFEGQGDVLPDGSEAGDVRRWQARHEAEAELAAAEAAVQAGAPGAAKRLRAAERKLDRVLEAALGEEGEWGDLVDDFDALEAPAEPPPPPAAGDPESFSRVDLNLPDSQLRRRFPEFPGKAAALEVEVEAGQMLYLPAGWFHEVTSFSTAASPAHMALNFWYHPPDNLGKGVEAAMAQPYRSQYWPAVWEGRRKAYEARHRPSAQQAEQPAAGGEQQSSKKQRLAAEGAAEGAAGRADEGALQPRRSRRRQRAAVAPPFFGLFGVGRRQHLHAFVGVSSGGRKRKAS